MPLWPLKRRFSNSRLSPRHMNVLRLSPTRM
ncbi:ORFL66W.iORF1 [Human betaherpesvirus 5]|nr:ORFL66W.iORF1 [Human betaherpesvirus 5]QHX40375.1 ORFL66W.iORF1 [Human betaherpesvirus 5]